MICPENRYIYLRDIMKKRLPHLRSFQIQADGFICGLLWILKDEDAAAVLFLLPAFANRRAKVNSDEQFIHCKCPVLQ